MRFLQILSRHQRDENGKCSHPWTGDKTTEKVAEKKSQEIEWIEFLAIFFLWFFQMLCRQFKGGSTCTFHRTRMTQQNLNKSHHQHKQNIARVVVA